MNELKTPGGKTLDTYICPQTAHVKIKLVEGGAGNAKGYGFGEEEEGYQQSISETPADEESQQAFDF